jgi:hypothetical protein
MVSQRYNAVCLRVALTDMDANLLCNYAMYCTNIKHNLKKAEDLYKRILISYPNHTEANGMIVLLVFPFGWH